MKTLALVFLFPGLAIAACDVPAALQNLRPGAHWNVIGNTYAGITWLDQVQVQPTQTQVTNWLSTCTVTPDDMVLATARANAIAQINGNLANAEAQRAILLTLLDQINTIRSALPTPLSAITPAQAKTAVINKINSGSAD